MAVVRGTPRRGSRAAADSARACSGCPAPSPGLVRRASGAASQRRDAPAALAGIQGEPSGRVPVHPVRHPIPGLGEHARSRAAVRSPGRQEGLRRLCGPDASSRRPFHGRDPRGPALRRNARGEQLHLRRADLDTESAGLHRLARPDVQLLRGSPEAHHPGQHPAGVRHACYYEPDVNPTYLDLARHYGTTLLPTRTAAPRDNAKVETSVQICERWILAPLPTLVGLAEANREVFRLLEELNDRPFQKLPGCRRSRFEELDRPELSPLPSTPYTYAE